MKFAAPASRSVQASYKLLSLKSKELSGSWDFVSKVEQGYKHLSRLRV